MEYIEKQLSDKIIETIRNNEISLTYEQAKKVLAYTSSRLDEISKKQKVA